MMHQLTVITRHGPVHGAVLQGYQDLPSQMAPLMTHILSYDHAPHRSAVSLARVMPSTGNGVFNILVVWAERQSHRVSVVLDRRMVGGDLDLVEATIGTSPAQVLTTDDRRHGWHFSVNGDRCIRNV